MLSFFFLLVIKVLTLKMIYKNLTVAHFICKCVKRIFDMFDILVYVLFFLCLCFFG